MGTANGKHTDARASGVSVERADITTLRADAIVTAANAGLTGCRRRGHCVDAAVFAAAGEGVFRACEAVGGCAPGDVVVTPAFRMTSAQHVVHAVGPVWDQCTEREAVALLRSCYERALDAAHDVGARSVAFSCISAGLYGAPPRLAARTAVETVQMWLDTHPDVDMDVIFCVFDDRNERIYREIVKRDID
jgi:O-acetyl-ADP-ribose deacetylase